MFALLSTTLSEVCLHSHRRSGQWNALCIPHWPAAWKVAVPARPSPLLLTVGTFGRWPMWPMWPMTHARCRVVRPLARKCLQLHRGAVPPGRKQHGSGDHCCSCKLRCRICGLRVVDGVAVTTDLLTKDLRVQGRDHSARIATLSSASAAHTTLAGKAILREIVQNGTFAWRSLPMCRYLH